MENKINPIMVCHGAVTNKFNHLALLKKIKSTLVKQTRVDCYEVPPSQRIIIFDKFKELDIKIPETLEVFSPSENYPPHVDSEPNVNDISYFIPLEEGIFFYNDIHHPVLPYVLYSFSDSILHNTNFPSVMLK